MRGFLQASLVPAKTRRVNLRCTVLSKLLSADRRCRKWKPTLNDIEGLHIERLLASMEKATWNFESLKKTSKQEAGSATCASETTAQSSDPTVLSNAATVDSVLLPVSKLPPKGLNSIDTLAKDSDTGCHASAPPFVSFSAGVQDKQRVD